MNYDVLHAIEHYSGLRKEPGETVTAAELAAAGQTADDVKRLVKAGAIAPQKK